MAITQWQENVARRVKQFVSDEFHSQASEFDSELECSRNSARCVWWYLTGDNEGYDNSLVRFLVVIFPEDSWDYLDESIEFRVEINHGCCISLSQQDLNNIRNALIQKEIVPVDNWKAVQDNGVIVIKLYEKESNWGRYDDDSDEELSKHLLRINFHLTILVANAFSEMIRCYQEYVWHNQ